MEEDYYFDDMEMEDYNDDGLDGVTYEQLVEYFNNYEGEITPEMLELLEVYKQRSGQSALDISRIPVPELFENCVYPSCSQALQQLLPLFFMCALFRFFCYFNRAGSKESRVPAWLIHLVSAIMGIMVLRSFFGTLLVYLATCCALAYFTFCGVCSWNQKYCGFAGAIVVLVFCITCELFVVDPTIWHKIRGSQIILSMKIISLGVDIGKGDIVDLPNIFEFMGYCFNVGSVIFGPWISYAQYYKLLENETVGPLWFVQVLLTSSVGMFCLVYSNCLTHWFILDDSHKWILAYRDAQSFRLSHYFVCFISDATSSLSGLVLNDDSAWNVVRPLHIEVPRSLVEVVTNWNLPMHNWLKTYVFKVVRPLGVFAAVLTTYAASSLLHGLNFQLGAVLFSLGFYSYTEFVFRRRLSQIFDACIQAKRCKPKCDHKYTSKHPLVFLVNLCFGALAIFHLAYLGLMFDNSDEEEKGYTMWHTLDKWSGLNFLSHWVALGTFIVYYLV